jgi:hypothetical protein
MARVRELPRETDAIQFEGWEANGDEVLAFLAPFSAEPLLVPLSDPDNLTITAALYDATTGTFVSMRDGDWIVRDPDSSAVISMAPELFVVSWGPVT